LISSLPKRSFEGKSENKRIPREGDKQLAERWGRRKTKPEKLISTVALQRPGGRGGNGGIWGGGKEGWGAE